MDIKERMNYLGGSDCASALGLSRWKTTISLWAEKTGQIQPEDISEKISVKLGVKLEDTVAEMFTEKTGKKVRRVNKTLIHPKYPFICANIDREVVGEDAIFEAKTTSAYRAKEWAGEEIPQEFILQCMHYLAVTGEKKAYLAVLIGNQDFKIKEIERDEAMINEIISKEVHFWNEFVLKKSMPGIISASDSDVLLKLFPSALEGKEVMLPVSVENVCEELDALKRVRKSTDEEIKKKENELKSLVKENEVGIAGEYKIKWANIHKESYTVPAKDYRQLFIKKIEKEVD